MTIVPTHKQDLDACAALAIAPDAEVAADIDRLLEWLQDMNWPVAQHVVNRLKSLEESLINPVRQILNGGDDIWKFWVVSSLLSETRISLIQSLRADLERICQNPTDGEIQEGVNGAAKQVLGSARA